jgi:hypothetical protein
MSALGEDHPKSDEEMVRWYHEAALRLVQYARDHDLFDIPADYKLEVTVTPPRWKASIDGAAYYPAPPFQSGGVGRFYVTPTKGIRPSWRRPIAPPSPTSARTKASPATTGTTR